mgnify:CR=1 FL=1
MNSSFGIWLVGAGAVALVLLLLLGAPGVEREPAPDPELAETGDTDVASSYWRPVVEEASTSQAVNMPTTSVVTPSTASACPPCGATRADPAPLVGGCGRPSVPCGSTPCAPLTWGCYDVCADPCHVMKPGINRNMPLCVDECAFLQLHSTVPHPICGQVRFEWSASKGWFLDPTASDPLYFVPTTQFCQGEDVWITLLVTDASGVQYSDVVGLHVRDLP